MFVFQIQHFPAHGRAKLIEFSARNEKKQVSSSPKILRFRPWDNTGHQLLSFPVCQRRDRSRSVHPRYIFISPQLCFTYFCLWRWKLFLLPEAHTACWFPLIVAIFTNIQKSRDRLPRVFSNNKLPDVVCCQWLVAPLSISSSLRGNNLNPSRFCLSKIYRRSNKRHDFFARKMRRNEALKFRSLEEKFY